MDDWAVVPYDFSERIPWMVLRDGSVVFGDRGQLHDDLFDQHEVMFGGVGDRDVIAFGEISNGHVAQMRSINGEDYTSEAQEAYDEHHFEHTAAGPDEWAPEYNRPAGTTMYKFVHRPETGDIAWQNISEDYAGHDQMIQSFHAPHEPWEWKDWRTGYAEVRPDSNGNLVPQVKMYEADPILERYAWEQLQKLHPEVQNWPPEALSKPVGSPETPWDQIPGSQDLPAHLGGKRHAMPYSDNTWYHVTDRRNLPRIADEGLVGSERGTDRVWNDFPVEENAVYLWPNVSLAQNYARQQPKMGPVRWSYPTILRVNGIDRNNLSLDHESLGDAMEGVRERVGDGDPDAWEQELHDWYQGYLQQHPKPSNEFKDFTDWAGQQKKEFEHNIGALRAMPPHLREELARHRSQMNGDAVMHYGPIAPHQIDVGRLNVYGDDGSMEDVQDRFHEEHPEWQRGPEEDDDEDAWYEAHDQALDDWMAQQGEWVSPEDLDRWHEETLDYPEDDSNTRYYRWSPLGEHVEREFYSKTAAPEHDFTFPGEIQQQWGWEHRTPYIYLPERDQVFWGQPGQWHTPLSDFLRLRGYDMTREPSVYGSVYTNPDDPTQRFQEVHRGSWPNAYADHYTWEMEPQHYDLLAKRIGVPFGGHDDPEMTNADLEDLHDWTPKLTKTAAGNPLPEPYASQPWHNEEWLNGRSQYHSPYGDDVDPYMLRMPLFVTPDGRWAVGSPGQSHAYDESSNWTADDLGIRDMDWDTLRGLEGGVNVAGNGYQVHWPEDVPHNPELEAQIAQEALKTADDYRRSEWGKHHESLMLGDVDRPYGASDFDYTQRNEPQAGYRMRILHPELGVVEQPVDASVLDRSNLEMPYGWYHKQQGWPMRDEGWGSYPEPYPHMYIAPDDFEFGHHYPYDPELKYGTPEYEQRRNEILNQLRKTAAPEDWGPMRIEQLEEPYEFRMPDNIERGFANAFECPECHNHLRQSGNGLYCEHCGWQPRIASNVYDLAERATYIGRLMTKYLAEGMSWGHIAQYVQQFIMTQWPDMSPQDIAQVMKMGAEVASNGREPSIEDVGQQVTIPSSDQFFWGEVGNDPHWSKVANDEWAPAIDWEQGNGGAYFQKRKPWVYIPGQSVSFGGLGEHHPYSKPQGAWVGEVWEDTSPARVRVLAGPGWRDENERARVLAEAERAYFQQQDNPEQRQASNIESHQEGNKVFHSDPYGDVDIDYEWEPRTPYLYDPEHDLLHWGEPGWWHSDLRPIVHQWEANNGIERTTHGLVGGAVVDSNGTDDPHAVYERSLPVYSLENGQINPEYDRVRSRLEELVGAPIMSHENPDSILGYARQPTSDESSEESDWAPKLGALDDEWAPTLDTAETDGRAGRYPWAMLRDGTVLFGPEGGSHQQIAIYYGYGDHYGKIPFTALGEITHPFQTTEPDVYMYKNVGDTPHDDVLSKVGDAFRRGENIAPGSYVHSKVAADLVPGNEGHWVWLDGQVGFGGDHHEIARTLAQRLGYEPDKVNFISNTIARNGMPEGHQVAVGTIRGRYPQIFNSTVDRNAVWDDVARNYEGFSKSAGIKDDAQRAYESLVATGGFSLTQSLEAASGQAYFAAYENPTQVIPIEQLTPEGIIKWRHEVLPMLQSDPSNLIGGWLSEGLVYLDVSRAFQDEFTALQFARDNHQQAVWDGFNNVEIYVADYFGGNELREARLRKLGMSVQWAAPIFSEHLAAPTEHLDSRVAHMPEDVYPSPYAVHPLWRQETAGMPVAHRDELPEPYRSALQAYEAERGEEHDAQDVQHWGYGALPWSTIQHIMEQTEYPQGFYNAHYEWAPTQDMPQQHYAERWPLILGAHDRYMLRDGYHRMHDYWLSDPNGPVPVLWPSRPRVSARTSMADPSTYYHISPARNRDSIMQNGLVPMYDMQDFVPEDKRLLWIWNDPDLAREYATHQWGGSTDNDIWAFEHAGETEPDRDGMHPAARQLRTVVPADRLRRI